MTRTPEHTAGRRRWLAAAAALMLLAGIGWSAGFAWFLHSTAAAPPLPPYADAILALTGGAERVETALRLLGEGHARLLLVSGVGGPTEFTALARRAGVPEALRGRVTLGRVATSTRGNAEEAAAWARGRDVHSMIVVTAFYHMPRALAELSRTLPDVALYPAPVRAEALPNPASLRLLAAEYSKFLVSALGVSGLVAHDVAPDMRKEVGEWRGPGPGG